MKADVQRERIQTEMDRVLEAVTEAEAARVKIRERAGQATAYAPSGVDLHQIQLELYNVDNGILLTSLTDTIVRDRLNRLIVEVKLFTMKTGRERIYMTPDTYLARESYIKGLAQKKTDREDRVTQLAADLGYPVNWYLNAPFRSRHETVVINIEDLEAIAQKI